MSRSWSVDLSASAPALDRAIDGLASRTRNGVTVALHGYLSNFDSFAQELRVQATRDDDVASVVLEAWLRWGAAALGRLRGCFVLVAIDEPAGIVTVARDPLGTHPLFFAEAGRRLLFGESARRLVRMPGVARTLNRAALADHLCHRWPHGDETFFDAVRRVLPGHCLVLSPAGIRRYRYWDPAPEDRPVNWATEEEVGQFAALLDQSVDRCLAAGPTGVFLSGGLDSISVAAVAAARSRSLNYPLPQALSLAMPDPECDERERQARVAGTLGLPFDLVDFDDATGSRGLIVAAADLGRQLSSPVLNTWGPAYLALAARGAARGVRTVMSGSGGDEWLSVSPYVSADLIARGDLSSWYSFYGAFRRSYRHSLLRQLELTTWTFGLRPLASQALSRVAPTIWRASRHRRAVGRDPRWVAPDAALRRHMRERASLALEEVDPPHGFYLREVRSGLTHPLTSWELEEQYEFAAQAGVRFLHPYWDADLVDMLYRTPPRLLIRDGRAKSLVRQEMARQFPDLGLERQRKVAATGFYQGMVRRQASAAHAVLGECRTLADLGVIDQDASRRYFEADFGSTSNTWDVINLESWVRANA